MSDSERENSWLDSTNNREDGTVEPLVNSLNNINEENEDSEKEKNSVHRSDEKDNIVNVENVHDEKCENSCFAYHCTQASEPGRHTIPHHVHIWTKLKTV